MLAVIYRASRSHRGNFCFFFPRDAVAATAASQRSKNVGLSQMAGIELEELLIKPGLNFVEPEKWEKLASHSINADIIADFTKKQILSVFKPDAEEAIGSTSDFSSVEVAQELIANTKYDDINWLRLCLGNDRRQPIFQAIGLRIQELEEDHKARASEGSLNLQG